jgi:hypothetical protein
MANEGLHTPQFDGGQVSIPVFENFIQRLKFYDIAPGGSGGVSFYVLHGLQGNTSVMVCSMQRKHLSAFARLSNGWTLTVV